MQLDARLHPAAQKAPEGIERNAKVAMDRHLMQLI
jgi:hypothetical protein